ncbi:RNA polymerase sigma factor FliA [Guyparkeria hydrothermalis]|uniref:RNA polymerase sigma factor FliA n=1 Tax=Guyparkeria hydrothermalis TaxID=923 RepID=UPI002021B657|nr:RNA polymerase sigma factor FliA [Guyparkeria hydrothermalis]MCL7745419.1 RNA polymerase sigma factor FliA [Guyparkeria hydrothermalis]
MNARAMYQNVQAGSTEALVTKHAGLVKRVAFHLLGRLPSHIQAEDLIQAGMVGLLDAARLFDGDKGASFETYAGLRIRGAMLDEVRRNDWAPRSVYRRQREIAQTVAEIESETGREARDAEVCERMGLTLDEYHAAMSDASTVHVTSLDHAGEGENETYDVADPHSQQPDEALAENHFQRDLAGYIDELPERERLVMSLYYVDELNQKEIGAVLGVSESRVCQIHNKAIMRLKTAMNAWK